METGPEEEVKCRLEEVLATREGRVAVISLDGTMWSPEKKDSNAAIFSGGIRFGLDKMMIRQEVHIRTEDMMTNRVLDLRVKPSPLKSRQE
jgi:hypothetical protein